jgi:hypothetical protein
MKWDDFLENDLLKSWINWKSLLPLMTQISIPRCFYRLPDHDDAVVELHHFCDASEIGYGTVSYLRIIYSDGTINCSFAMGKSRNAPIRSPTIPRLELQSALLAVRMNKMIKDELDITVHEHGGRRRHEIRQGSNNFLSLFRNITKLPHRMEFDIPENPMFFVFRYCYILAGK